MKTTTDRTTDITPVEAERLSASLRVLLPRIEFITGEFCRLVELADPTLRLRFPSDEREIAPVLARVLGLVEGHQEHDHALIATLAREGAGAGVAEENLPTLRAAIQTAIAEASGYTWTERLERAWSHWFDGLVEQALDCARSDQSLAA